MKDLPAYSFPKKSIYCNGQLIEANIWYVSQKKYLEQALAMLAGEQG